VADREERDLLQGSVGPMGPLDDAQVEALARDGHRQHFPRGALLYEQGQPAEFLHVLLDGAVALSAAGDDRHATVVELVQPVECFGLGPVLEAGTHALTARAIEPSRLLLVPADEVRRLVADEPALALAMLGWLSAQNRQLVEQIKDLKLRNGTQRLGCWLLRLVDEQGQDRQARLAVPKGLLAQRLGMTAESLSRAFAVLREQGLDVQGSLVEILDRARLEAFCRP
jgi:CRP/FNR family transcriptional activator FtrB